MITGMRHIYLCDWQDFFLSGEGWGFLPEVMLRSFIAFAVVLLALKLTARKASGNSPCSNWSLS